MWKCSSIIHFTEQHLGFKKVSLYVWLMLPPPTGCTCKSSHDVPYACASNFFKSSYKGCGSMDAKNYFGKIAIVE
jgi:hypothetical protein